VAIRFAQCLRKAIRVGLYYPLRASELKVTCAAAHPIPKPPTYFGSSIGSTRRSSPCSALSSSSQVVLHEV